MEKLIVILVVCFLFVADVESGTFWGCATRGECSSEETTETSNAKQKNTNSDNIDLGDPLTDKEIEDAETYEGIEPDQDPTEQDSKNFEGDIKRLKYETLKGYNKDAAEIQKYFDSLEKTDPNGHMDLSGLHLDPVLWRNAIKAKNGLLPKAQIPYWLANSYNSIERIAIAAAMADFRKYTCIRQGRMQIMSLGNGCLTKGTVLHELMHAAGFFHEQARMDRDRYVTVNWNNIRRDKRDQFQSYGSDKITYLGTRYDYNSIMHYLQTAFSYNGRPTIVPRRRNARIGQSSRLSRNDIRKLNRLYQCNSRKQCKNKRSWCNYYWIDTYCYSGWMQRSCPNVCGIC